MCCFHACSCILLLFVLSPTFSSKGRITLKLGAEAKRVTDKRPAMEGGGALQAHELHKKFEDLNEEISTALRHQQDALSSTSSRSGGGASAHTKKDVVRLAKRALDWREDVTALAKHIELQLQHSRALRGHEAHGLLSTSAANRKQQEDDESAKLCCLRSDLRLLLDFRVGFFQRTSANDASGAQALLSMAEAETVRRGAGLLAWSPMCCTCFLVITLWCTMYAVCCLLAGNRRSCGTFSRRVPRRRRRAPRTRSSSSSLRRGVSS